MPLTKEQVANLKKQLLEQVNHLPQDQRKEAERQIKEMSDSAIEEMLALQKDSHPKIFRDIVSGKISSKKVEESKEAIAVLDIKPISRGHTVIIPKEKVDSTDKVPQLINKFAEKVAETLSKKLKAKSVRVVSEVKFGEAVINLIPIYDKDLTLESKRLDSSDEELSKVLEEIHKKEEKKEEVVVKKEPLKKLPRRIP